MIHLVKDRIAEHAEDIATLFKNPKITIIVRAPDLQDGDLVVTDDDLDLVVAAIERLKKNESSVTME